MGYGVYDARTDVLMTGDEELEMKNDHLMQGVLVHYGGKFLC